MRVATDCDDASIELKQVIIQHLRSLGVEVDDLNLMGSRPVDYPDVGFNLRLTPSSALVQPTLITNMSSGTKSVR
jgi:ribose 5-phosphate isomerase RpiB